MKPLRNDRGWDRWLASPCTSIAGDYRKTIGVCLGSVFSVEVYCVKSLKNDRGFDRSLAWQCSSNAYSYPETMGFVLGTCFLLRLNV